MVEPVGRLLELLQGYIAQRPNPKQPCRVLALPAALIVLRIDQSAAGNGVENHHCAASGERRRVDFQRAAVYKQSVPGYSARRYQLVHYPALNAHPVILGFLGK